MRRISVGGLNSGRAAVQARKVAPPSVPPEKSLRNSGSSFGSAGYASAGEDPVFLDPKDCLEQTDGVCGGASPGAYTCSTFTFPASQGHGPVSGKAAGTVLYCQHQCLQEDQGIDMTQSPGRDSPGSSGSGSRHSTVSSVDSGRASSCHHPLQSRPSLSSASTSSNSTGDHRSISASTRAFRLLQQGVPDQDVLQSWLTDLHFEEYYPLFVSAGYDMHTIIRMTPEDLTAIGIKKPLHRKKLKAEIAQLNISDGLPDYIPSCLSEWLKLLRLEEYEGALRSQGITSVDDTTRIQVEDLEDLGIIKLGHQKRLLLAIKRLRDLRAGKIFPPTPFSQPMMECRCWRWDPAESIPPLHVPTETSVINHVPADLVPIQVRGVRGKSLESLEGDGAGRQSGMDSVVSSFTGGWLPTNRPRGWMDDADLAVDPPPRHHIYPQGGGTLPRQRPSHLRPRHSVSLLQEGEMLRREGESLLTAPLIPQAADCPACGPTSNVTVVVADLHTTPRPTLHFDQASFKSSSSAESDSLPFANENAGTIKQRAGRNQLDYIPPVRIESTLNDSSLSAVTSGMVGKDSEDVLNDIGNMLANLTDELDAMLLEEKRQAFAQDSVDY